MIRPGTVIWLLLIVIVGFTLFQVKYEVMQQEETLARLNTQIAEGRERLRVLDAEWSYLTRPDRLNRLAAKYLDLQPMSAAQIVDLAAIPERADAPAPLVRNATAIRSRSGAPASTVTVPTEPRLAKAATGIQP
jgi:cell division protein FtsL